VEIGGAYGFVYYVEPGHLEQHAPDVKIEEEAYGQYF
jgi:hypothetical protein